MAETENKVAEYYRLHKCCPKCGRMVSRDNNSPVEVDITGYDGNRAICPDDDRKKEGACRWEGVMHELVAEGQSEADKKESSNES